MMKLLVKLLLTKQLKFEDGKILLKDIPLNMDSAQFISRLTQYFIHSNKLTDFYFLSWIFGFTLVKKFIKRFNIKDPDEIYKIGMDLAEALGSGLYRTHHYDWKKYTFFEIDSPYVKFFDKSLHKGPVCWYIAGAMGGGGSLVHGEPCQCIETQCKIQGYEKCKFLIGTEKELKQRGLWKQLEKQIDLKKIYPLQKLIFQKHNEKNESKLLEKIIIKYININL